MVAISSLGENREHLLHSFGTKYRGEMKNMISLGVPEREDPSSKECSRAKEGYACQERHMAGTWRAVRFCSTGEQQL
jgi:hypothetical protein